MTMTKFGTANKSLHPTVSSVTAVACCPGHAATAAPAAPAGELTRYGYLLLPMIKNLIVAVFAVLLVSCSSGVIKPETWHASTDNGDKVGVGIELIRSSAGLSGAIYILDPSKPHDFTAGRRCPMQIQRSEPQDLYFRVETLPGKLYDMHLHFATFLQGEKIQSTLQRADGSDSLDNYELHKFP